MKQKQVIERKKKELCLSLSKAKYTYKGVVTSHQDCRLQTQQSRYLCKFHGHFGFLRPNYVEEICKPRNCRHLIDLEAISEQRRCDFFDILPGVGISDR